MTLSATLGLYDQSAKIIDYTTITYQTTKAESGFTATWSCTDGFSKYAGVTPSESNVAITPDRIATFNCKVLSTNASAVYSGAGNNTLSITFSFLKPYVGSGTVEDLNLANGITYKTFMQLDLPASMGGKKTLSSATMNLLEPTKSGSMALKMGMSLISIILYVI